MGENVDGKRSKKYFGTDGIRGVAGVKPLEPSFLVRLGKAIATIFVQQNGRHRILIGKDTRLSGYMIETSLAAGITSVGAEVLLVGPIPTPGVAYLTRSMRADAGIMISASHNSFEDNGIKIFGSDGYKLADELELHLEKMLDDPEKLLECTEPGRIGKATRIDDAVGRYTVFLKEAVPRQISFEGLKVGMDTANGAAYLVGPQTLRELGAEVVVRGNSPSGKNINAGFGSLYPEVVSKLVKDQTLDIGISLDGDADRAIFVDEKGRVVDGDEVLAICAVDLADRGLLDRNVVVATVMSNLGLDHYLQKRNIEVRRTGVGDRNVLEEMVRCGASIGGEQSGHTIFASHGTTGDGILTALMLTSVMLRRERPLSELCEEFERFPQKLINISVMQKTPLEEIPNLTETIQKVEKTLGDKGRVLVRYSGTENLLRVMVECDNEEDCKKFASDIAEVVDREIGVV